MTLLRKIFIALLILGCSFANAKEQKVFLTVAVINNSIREKILLHMDDYGLNSELKPYLSSQINDIQFRTIITSSRETAMAKMKTILKTNEVLHGLHVVVHGNNVRSTDGTKSTTYQDKIGEIVSEYNPETESYSGRVDSSFREFFSTLKGKISPDIKVVFTSCLNLDVENSKFNLEKIKAVANFFNIKNGSLYFSSSLDVSMFSISNRDYFNSRFSKEYLYFALKSILTLTIVSALVGNDAYTLDSLMRNSIDALLIHAAVLEPTKIFLSNLKSHIVNFKVTGWLYVLKDGDAIRYEVKDKLSRYAEIFGAPSFQQRSFSNLKCSALFN